MNQNTLRTKRAPVDAHRLADFTPEVGMRVRTNGSGSGLTWGISFVEGYISEVADDHLVLSPFVPHFDEGGEGKVNDSNWFINFGDSAGDGWIELISNNLVQ